MWADQQIEQTKLNNKAYEWGVDACKKNGLAIANASIKCASADSVDDARAMHVATERAKGSKFDEEAWKLGEKACSDLGKVVVHADIQCKVRRKPADEVLADLVLAD